MFAGAASSGFTIIKSNKARFNGLPANALKYTDAAGYPQTFETVYTLGDIPDKLALRSSSAVKDYSDKFVIGETES